MRRDDAFFGQQELALIYIAKKLQEAQQLEAVLDVAGLDYLIEPDTFLGGFLFRSERIGAFFYVTDEMLARAQSVLKASGFPPYEPTV